MLTVAFLCFLVKVLRLFTADPPKPSQAPPPASRPAVSYCLSLMISSRGLAPPKIFEFGLATWFSGSETVRGFSCSRGRCARSSGRNQAITSCKYHTGSEICSFKMLECKVSKPNTSSHQQSWKTCSCREVESVCFLQRKVCFQKVPLLTEPWLTQSRTQSLKTPEWNKQEVISPSEGSLKSVVPPRGGPSL